MPHPLRLLLVALWIFVDTVTPAQALDPIPDKLVVLKFDDSVASHFSVVRPTLKRLGFNATSFITEGFTFLANKQDYMTYLQTNGFKAIALRDLARYVVLRKK